MVSKDNSKFLLLMSVGNNNGMFGGKGGTVNDIQKLDIASISGRSYYRLKFTLTKGSHIKVVDGAISNLYSQSMFVKDWENNTGWIRVKFDGTNISHSFSWKKIVNNPFTFMFFGAPLTRTRNFDSIFRGISSTATLHHRFMCYWKEVEGDVIASHALLNSYQSYRLGVMTSKHDKIQKQSKKDK